MDAFDIMSQPRILIVEDDPSSQDLLMATLSGYETRLCNSPSKAFELVKSQDFDLITLDIHFTGMTGLRFLGLLRSQLKSPTPVIVCSGTPEPGLQEKALELGAQAFIRKPYRPEQLLETVHSVLEGGA